MKRLIRLFRRPHRSERFALPEGTIVDTITPSPDSTRLAYIYRNRRGYHVAVNGVTHRSFRAVAIAKIIFSPDSSRIAYVAGPTGQALVVWGNQEYGPYTAVERSSPVVSPDSEHVAYAIRKHDGWYAVLDGRDVYGPAEGFCPGGIVFSPDSQKIGFVVKKEDFWLAVVDGQEKHPHPMIFPGTWRFAPDCRRFAYIAGISRKGEGFGEDAVIVDDCVSPAWPHDEGRGSGLVAEVYFSTDSSRIAYGVRQNGQFAVIVDGIQHGWYDGFLSGWAANADWPRFPAYGRAGHLTGRISFSPDSRHVAFAVAKGKSHMVVFDGSVKAVYQAVTNAPIEFSPDSTRIAYGVEENSRQFLVVDWSPWERWHGIVGSGRFSPDSKHIAYVCIQTPETFCMALDHGHHEMNWAPLVGSSVIWDTATECHVLVVRTHQSRPLWILRSATGDHRVLPRKLGVHIERYECPGEVGTPS